MPAFSRVPKQFFCKGMNLNMPIDRIPEGEYALLQNIRQYQAGRLESRPGLDLVYGGFPVVSQLDYIHSYYELDDPNPDTTGGTKQFVGYNNQLYWADLVFPSAFNFIDAGFSGNPLSFIAFSPEANPTPFLYIYDSLKMEKVSASYKVSPTVPQIYPIGVPQSAVYAATAPVPTIAAGDVTGGPYYWRWQLRHATTGAVSIPGPPTQGTFVAGPPTSYIGVFLTAEKATFADPAISITGNLAHDQEYTWDLYRSGSAISTSWKFIGTLKNRSGDTLEDDNNDIDIASATSLPTDAASIKYAPYLSPDIPRSGTTVFTTIADPTLSGVTGGNGSLVNSSGFNINWIPGTEIFIDGGAYTVSYVISTSNLVIVEDLGGDLGAVEWSVNGALESGQPLPYSWGPFGAGFFGQYIFSCGNLRSPGTLYWTNGNDPDSVSETNTLELTDSSEPLQNGCVWNGRVWVWSKERMWEVVPDLVNAGQFVAQVVPGAKGLPYNWCFCVGDLMYWLSWDGVYSYSGAGLPVCLSDHQLQTLLGHDGVQGVTVELPNPEAFGSNIIIRPPNPNRGAYLRMHWNQGMLFFDYLDTVTQPRTLIYDSHIIKGWTTDKYGPSGMPVHFTVPEFGLLLVATGHTLSQSNGNADLGVAIETIIMTPADPLGDIRSMKLIGDAVVGSATQAASNVHAKVLLNNNSAVGAAANLTPSGAYLQTRLDVDFAPIDTATNALSRTVGLWIYGVTTAALWFFDWEPSFVMKPETTGKRATDWNDDGNPGDKWFYGVLIEANTFGLARTVQIYGDDNTLFATLTVNHPIQETKPYFFDTPLISHQVRVVPVDENQWDLFKLIWKWYPKPEYTRFQQDWTDDGFNGPKFLQGFVLEGDTKGLPVEVQLRFDGDQLLQTFTVNHNGQLEKPYPVTTPQIVHEMRLVPSGNNIRYMDPFKITWVYTKHPELTTWVEDNSPSDPMSYRGVAIEADTLGLDVEMEVRAVVAGAIPQEVVARTLTINHKGRQQKAYAFGESILTTEIRLVPVPSVLAGGNPLRHYTTRWIGDPRPDLSPLYTDYTDDGYESSKFFQGFTLWADTRDSADVPQDITMTIEYDGGQTGGVFTKVNHNGNLQIEYSFPTPFIAHQVRAIPSGPLRYNGPWKIRWIWEPAPDLAKNWITQTTSHGLRGFHHHRDCYIALQSFAAVLLRVKLDDGTQYDYIISSTNGDIKKPYEVLQHMKGKLSQYSLISCKPFRVFQKDCEMRVKEWGTNGEYLVTRPFGGPHFQKGAII